MTSTSGFKNWALLVSGAALVAAGGAFHFSTSDAGPEAVASMDAGAFPAPDPNLPVVKVWKSPSCGCCGAWVEHMRHAGFAVEVEDVPDVTPVKRELGVAPQLHSCHTALVEGYALEGHVPAEDILRLLEERPEVAGLAVPGMPVGSPGMEMGSQKDPYDVVAFDREGGTRVWASHR